MDATPAPSHYPHGLPAKRMATAALLLSEDGRLLIVKPWYRDYWLLPGGVVEADESPRQGCARETLEELGLEAAPLRLLCVDYTPAMSNSTESLQFVFWSGYLSAAQLAAIHLQAEELTEWRLVTPAEAAALLNPRLARRLPACLAALASDAGAVYLEDGEEVVS
ncbi:MAG TPA: NUDIX hydrolase [Ktedonobacterales bacterium]|jgi:8-oxo-dGTP diphosphatase|nr:NUDIX hydrolase [Ktedonobacterales bacterium]